MDEMMVKRRRWSASMLLLVTTIGVLACGKTLPPTQFLNPNFDFAFIEKVAVLPLENLSNDRQAGVRATRLLITELLSTGAVDVVEPGEVQAALDRVVHQRTPTTAEIIEIGRTLEVQGVVLGSVSQSESLRAGTVSVPVVTLDVHMLETETGTSVWAVTHTEKGSGLSAKFLGTGSEPISETTRRCVQTIVATLVQ
jgi:TolB-like protein